MKLPDLLILGAFLAIPSWALDVVPYHADSFAQARAAGKVTALQFHSGWCPVCVMQSRSLAGLKNDPQLANVVVFQADFAKEDELRRRFGVHAFSTLVIFRGEEERARTTGDFEPEKLKALFAKAL
ncbi:MAG: thioredoxin family protein [Rhodocyclaceae bacterium]